MKMKLTNAWKKRLLCLAALICGLAILATGTAANFVVEETAYNVITTGLLYMELVEETTGGHPWPEGGVSGIMPGMDVDKVVYVENVGSVPFYTREAMEMFSTFAKGGAGVVTLGEAGVHAADVRALDAALNR